MRPVPAIRRTTFLLGLLLIDHAPLMAQGVPRSAEELRKLSIEQLMNVEVTSVSRAEETLGGAAAALAVVTNEDIRRSGATSVPEALRMLPGLHVARITSSSWAIAARGFSSVNSEKLLVLSDTRSIYTPLFSGVLWDVQNYLLQDIDRIEVIRGPGATLWGSNAVNGVINITTKHARDTQGLFVSTTGGNENRGVAARYGGSFGAEGYYRAFVRYADRSASSVPDDINEDDWEIGHVGFRADWEADADDGFTVQGDLYQGEAGQLAPAVMVSGRAGPPSPLRVSMSGGNVLARWRRQTSPDSDLQVRAYYDRTHRDDPSFLDDLHTFDVDLLHRFGAGTRHDLTWGMNYRFWSNDNRGRVVFNLDPPDSRDALIAGFVQDQIALTDRFHLTLGTKLEQNDFSGFEVQPSGRVAWDASVLHTVWGAVSRAVRVPTRLERDIAIELTSPSLRLLGNPEFESEELIAYEGGYRWQALPSLFVDIAAFHNRYDGLASLEIGGQFFDASLGHDVLPIVNQNLTAGKATGVEALVTFMPVDRWRVTGSSSFLELDLVPAGLDANRGVTFELGTPQHQLGVRSYLDLPREFQVDAMFRHLTAVRRVPQIVDNVRVPAYAELDLRLAWRGWEDLELSLVGQNLLHDSHVEFGDPVARGAIERAAYVRATWGF